MYWITLEVKADNDADAETIAQVMRDAQNVGPGRASCRIIDVQFAPPQGSTIVGDMHEDAL